MAAKPKGVTVPRFSASGTKSGTTTLPESLFGQKPNKTLLAQAVRVYLSNQRSAHAKVKSRGEIKASTRKVYRQKGTGGARHGARSAPIFVGGGIAHGPRGIENYDLKLSRVLRKKALVSALSARAEAGHVIVCDLDKVEPKTRQVAQILEKLSLSWPLTILHAGGKDLLRAGRNLPKVNLVSAKTASAYHVLLGKSLIVTPEAVGILEGETK